MKIEKKEKNDYAEWLVGKGKLILVYWICFVCICISMACRLTAKGGEMGVNMNTPRMMHVYQREGWL
eukprot:UN09534